jgi:phosphatidate cytidylyltransferase
MLRRTLTALILIPPVIYLIGWSPKWLFLLALGVTVERGLYEYFALTRQAGFKALPMLGYLAGAAACLVQTAGLNGPGRLSSAFWLLTLLLVLALGLWRISDLKDYLGAVASTLFGIFYVAFTLSCLFPLRFSDPAEGRRRMLLLFLVIWAGDIFAFLVGRAVGRRLLFPRVSPKKTIEGAVAGFLGSLLVAWVFARWFWQTADLKTVMLLAGLIALSGQLGDLVESALKRGANVKDSGALLPGHGGLLDRIDSLLLSAPAFWLALVLRDFWP